ncbi:MAG: hypothetical protein H6548_06530 [Chitinophagales bacterium]|nr:hypothetical protein [Chitinophagales bacterium]HAE13254.1 hypothetical protein [Bacteroidota bacterium]MCB9021756.1 hypothetical protein [Chitinophagales bacterium]MCB9030993.1 hypothetical protein [Chitinophagales bacterium]HAE34212.1 hypothetical protein [Bacteroidota bacterium]
MSSLFTAFLLSAGIMSNAAAVSEPVPATINDQMQIVLPADQPLAAVYAFSIADLKFTEAAQAEQFFSMFTENVVVYVVDFESRTVQVYLQDIMTPAWDITAWNDYFAARSMKMKVVYDAL